MKSNILSIETSGAACSIAISQDDRILCEYGIYVFNKHDKLLAELIRRALNDVDLSVENLDAVAISAGPGSFTGLRIGAALAKGLCYGGSPKLIAIPTLEALAYNAYLHSNLKNYNEIAAVIPSHKNLIYFQQFDINCVPVNGVIVMPVEEVLFDLENTFVCGPATDKLSLTKNDNFDIPRASFISKLANNKFQKGIFDDAEQFSPMYVQEFIPKQKSGE